MRCNLSTYHNVRIALYNELSCVVERLGFPSPQIGESDRSCIEKLLFCIKSLDQVIDQLVEVTPLEVLLTSDLNLLREKAKSRADYINFFNQIK